MDETIRRFTQRAEATRFCQLMGLQLVVIREPRSTNHQSAKPDYTLGDALM